MERIPKWFRQFAEENNLKISRDPCDGFWILGLYGHFSIYHTEREFTENPERKMICVALERKSTATAKNTLLSMKPDLVLQECDTELIVAVDVSRLEFLEKARQILKIRKGLALSDADRERRSEHCKKLAQKRSEAA